MLSFTKKLSRQQYIVLPIALFVFFAVFLGDSAENAAAQRNSAQTKATPNKKTAKATPTPAKKTQAKATPTPKKSNDKKGKDNSSSKNSTNKTASKNKASDRDKQNSSRSSRSNSKSNQKNSDKKTDDSKRAANNKQNDKNKRGDNSRNKSAENKSSSSRTTNTKNSDRKTSVSNRNTDRNTEKSTGSTTRTTTTKRQQAQQPDIIADLPQIIVTDVAARVRSQAQPNAPELSRLRLGTVLKVTEKNPAWYRVQYTASGGKTANGWISANSVNDLNSGAREELYRQIVDRNYRAEMDFAAASEMFEFLTQISSELGNSNAAAELELKRLLTLKTALKKIPTGQSDRPPYREFLKAHEKSVIYSDPAAEWYVVSNLFWDLHKKYARTALADQIAWEAATNNLPGECEGYVNCYIFSERMTNGEYLRLHPNGKKATEALGNLTRALSIIISGLEQKTPYDGPTDVTDRAEFNNLIAELRTIVSRLPLTEKEKTLQQLKQVAEAFR